MLVEPSWFINPTEEECLIWVEHSFSHVGIRSLSGGALGNIPPLNYMSWNFYAGKMKLQFGIKLIIVTQCDQIISYVMYSERYISYHIISYVGKSL